MGTEFFGLTRYWFAPEPMDPEAPDTFAAWLLDDTGRTLYEFAFHVSL